MKTVKKLYKSSLNVYEKKKIEVERHSFSIIDQRAISSKWIEWEYAFNFYKLKSNSCTEPKSDGWSSISKVCFKKALSKPWKKFK